MKSKIYLSKVVENACVYRKGMECSNCGYCKSKPSRVIKKLEDYYDYSLEMMFYKYSISKSEDLKVGDIIELTFDSDSDTDIYTFKILKKEKNIFILAEYYNKYSTIKEGFVAFDRGVKVINAVKELGIVL